MTILVTGASGQLGRLVVESLQARGIPAEQIVAGVRNPGKATDLAAAGVRIVELDYDRPETIAPALDGVNRVVLVSGSEVGKRIAQHKAVINAAADAGVELLAYTSLYHAAESPLPLAAEHLATEKLLADADLPVVILRNDWYTENYLADVQRAADTGAIVSAAGEGRVSSASRVDYAEAAARVVSEDGHAGKVYELAGDVAWSYHDLAAAASEILGREVVYTAVSPEQLTEGLRAAGLDEGTAAFVAALDAGIAAGALEASERQLSELIGRPTTPLVEGLRAALAR